MADVTRKPIHNHPPLQEMKIRMYGREYILDPEQDLAFTKSTVGEAGQTQAAVYAFYATVRDLAEAKVESYETLLSQKVAELDMKFRGNGELPNGVKITDEGVKQAIRNDDEYKKIQNALVETRSQAKQMGSIVKAFEQRHEQIKTVASRANNTTFNDRDVTVEVAADVRFVPKVSAEERQVGKHPSKV